MGRNSGYISTPSSRMMRGWKCNFCGEFEKDNLILALINCGRHWISSAQETWCIYKFANERSNILDENLKIYKWTYTILWNVSTDRSCRRYLIKREYSQKVRNDRFSIDGLTRFSETSRKKEIAIAFNEREHLRTYNFEEKRIWIRALNMKI